MKSAFVIAGTSSGSGKTTVTLSLLAALKRRGLKVQSFKAGPDYIDPAHHAQITGLPGQNLDTWMLSPQANRHIFARHALNADVSLVEGVMGLFDGVDGVRDEGSTAHLAKTLDLPVFLVIDARSMARSVAAIAKGFATLDPTVRVEGVILNRVGSKSHERILREALANYSCPPVVGVFGRSQSVALPERHLGLVIPEDMDLRQSWTDALADLAEESLDLQRLLSLTGLEHNLVEPPPYDRPCGRCIGVPRDKAFSFYYEENFRVLEELGASLVFFKPAEGEPLPPGLDALYLGGGYPELNAAAIAQNQGFLEGVRALARAGKKIYAECGGFMVLCRSIELAEGEVYPMAGLLPADIRMEQKLVRLGYREITGLSGELADLSARGHEFHYSRVARVDAPSPGLWLAKNARGEEVDAPLYGQGSVRGGYVHLHFASNPLMAKALLF